MYIYVGIGLRYRYRERRRSPAGLRDASDASLCIIPEGRGEEQRDR